jgi:peptidoglycan hydrolase-like protein with peptidoglycan-binding domain
VLVASLALAGAARAAETTPTGGTEATPAPAVKKVSVKRIQRALGIKADGVMGPQTRRAIRRFQRSNELRVTGGANAETLAALGFETSDQDRTLSGFPTVLARIAQCESGGDPTAVSADGRYRGKYQFSRATWKALGGTGDPAEADEATQDALALLLYRERGTDPWPHCGARDRD